MGQTVYSGGTVMVVSCCAGFGKMFERRNKTVQDLHKNTPASKSLQTLTGARRKR